MQADFQPWCAVVLFVTALAATPDVTIAASARAEPQDVPAPHFTQGQSWLFEQTEESGNAGFRQARLVESIERLDTDSMIVGSKLDGAPVGPTDQVMGLDWSKRRMDNGTPQITARPFSFPLHLGKTWSVDYVDPSRHGHQVSLRVHRAYHVVGWEDVTVPAGTFHALKIESKGTLDGLIEIPSTAVAGGAVEPGAATTFSTTHRGGTGHMLRATIGAMYYVPAVRNFIMSFEEQYNGEGVRVTRMSLRMISAPS